MVEAVVSFAVERLGDALIGETLFLLNVRNQVEDLRDELRRMCCFLKDADAKQQGDERVRNWIADIRNVAYDTEDVVDTFTLKIDVAPKFYYKEGFDGQESETSPKGWEGDPSYPV
ncbi:hypothetical protein C5167_029222 [Papaver somniferum]|nr:hypothetical protein C5167_029222 [Papaver somniferum]